MKATGGTRHVGQGELIVCSDNRTMLTAILGSCVAACLWDSVRGVGGMNHILLPDGVESDLRQRLVGTNAMELLINELLRKGADRALLRGKLFGGARMIAGLSDIGARNSNFVTEFCRCEGIPVVASSLGGNEARRIQFWPGSGRARQRLLRDVQVQEPSPRNEHLESSDVELF